jgi:hypothetical protein
VTLILTQASPRYVLQVSDRLLTRRSREFDPVSNKSILYLANDALVSIAYSGRAYLDETSTDQWIVELLTGERLLSDDQRDPETGLRRNPLNIDQFIELLRVQLGAAVLRLPPTAGSLTLHLIVAGWQWEGDQAYPIVTHILNSPAEASVFHVRPIRLPEVEDSTSIPMVLCPVPTRNQLSEDDYRQLFEQLQRVNSSPDDSRRVLVEAIRLAAAKQPKLVSEECMYIYLPPPSFRSAEVAFVSPQEQRAAVIGKIHEVLPAAFTPWIVGPGKVVAPSILVGGGLSFDLGPFTINVTGPRVPSDAGIVFAWSSQRRPVDPQRRRPAP